VLTREPLPYQLRMWAAAAQHAACSCSDGPTTSGGGGGTPASPASPSGAPGSSHFISREAWPALPAFYGDWLAAHDALGLVRELQLSPSQAVSTAAAAAAAAGPRASPASPEQPPPRAWAFASIVPVKDAEVIVMGSHVGCPAFQALLHCALRALIDGLGVQTFNLALLNMDLAAPPPTGSSLWASADAAGVPAWLPAGARGAGAGVGGAGASAAGVAAGGSGLGTEGGGPPAPVVARIVGRGKLGSAASDYGCLEVFGGASIGHTDPFAVVQALERQIALVGQQQPQQAL
jgi:hypothetical protein